MKRNGKVVNARDAQEGRRMLRWGASGMNWAWAPGEGRDDLIKKSRSLLGRGHEFAARFARAADIAREVGGCLSQSHTSALIMAAGDSKEAAKAIRDLEHEIAERDADRPHWANWTYDAETDASVRLADAIRVAGAL